MSDASDSQIRFPVRQGMLPPPLSLPRRRVAPDSPLVPAVGVSAVPEVIAPVPTSRVEPRAEQLNKDIQEALERSLHEQESKLTERERKSDEQEKNLFAREQKSEEHERQLRQREEQTLDRERRVAAREVELAQAEAALWGAVEALQKIKAPRHA